MKQYNGNYTDENGRPVQGANVFVYTSEGGTAQIADANGNIVSQPLATDQDGNFSYRADEGYYRHQVWVGKRRVLIENEVIIGPSYREAAQAAAQAALAAAGVGEYADTAAGLAATVLDDTFWVDNGDGIGIIYRHDPGPVATEIGRFIKDVGGDGAAALLGATDGNVQLGLNARPTNAELAVAAGATKIGTKLAGAGTRLRTADEVFAERRSMLAMTGGVPDGATPQGVALTNLMQAGSRSVIPYYGFDYVLDAPVQLPPGAKLYFEGSPRILYTGADLGTHFDPTGVLIGDDEAEIASIDGRGTLTIESATPSRNLFAAIFSGKRGFKVDGLMGLECNHIRIQPSGFATFEPSVGYDPYDLVITSGENANVCRDFEITRGGATFSAPGASAFQHGAASIWYGFDGTIDAPFYENVAHGVTPWGGDANNAANGALGNERKCGNLNISRVRGRNFAGAGVFLAMVRESTVSDADCKGAGDVMYDFEGCDSSSFIRCKFHNAVHGGLSCFFFNRGVSFIDCEGIQDNPAHPFIRTYNSALSMDNRDVTIRGGRFECTSGIGVIDQANGPVRVLKLIDVDLVNVRIDAASGNNHVLDLIDVRQLFTVASATPFVARRFGLCNAYLGQVGRMKSQGGWIRSEVEQPAGSVAIMPVADDFNLAPTAIIDDTEVSGFANPVKPEPLGVNAGFNVIVQNCFFQSGNVRLSSSDFTVDAGTDIATHSIVALQTATPVRMTTATTLPAPLVVGTTYFVIRITETTCKFATSAANAFAGIAINLTDAGTGTHNMHQGATAANVTKHNNRDFAGAALA